jgi:hypothetical protein
MGIACNLTDQQHLEMCEQDNLGNKSNRITRIYLDHNLGRLSLMRIYLMDKVNSHCFDPKLTQQHTWMQVLCKIRLKKQT